MIVLYSLILVLHHYLLLSFHNSFASFALLRFVTHHLVKLSRHFDSMNSVYTNHLGDFVVSSKPFEACIFSNFHFCS